MWNSNRSYMKISHMKFSYVKSWIVKEMDRKLAVHDFFSVLTAFKPSCKL